MSARKGINLKRVKNQLELLEGILGQDATSRRKNISSRRALRIAQACVDKHSQTAGVMGRISVLS